MSNTFHRRALLLIFTWGLFSAMPTGAQQFDIHGPAGSVEFGSQTYVLPNGNIVAVDGGALSGAGAVYLYTPGGTLLSTLTGSSAGDQIGSYGITILANGNFVVSSPNWANGTNANSGAATWVNGSTGSSGVVSAANSLVGTSVSDLVGQRVYALSNGNYVVASDHWNNVAAAMAGAVTWANGSTGLTGPVTAANSLVGTMAMDSVGSGGLVMLSNGNYVIVSTGWHSQIGAVTWGNGNTGLVGPVTSSNSLVGSQSGDFVGEDGITALTNGNYVVASPSWANGTALNAGAVTWANGSTGISGIVSVSNSLVGGTQSDSVGGAASDLYGNRAVTALNNGNYVVASPFWHNASGKAVGAVTLADGSTGLSGTLAGSIISSSLVGFTDEDYVGSGGVTALSNGNYVVASPDWSNFGTTFEGGAVTWSDGNINVNTSGLVGAGNSLIGTTAYDQIGRNGSGAGGVFALTNGNYVIASSTWHNIAGDEVGAATWVNGSAAASGQIAAANSLVGSTNGDDVGYYITALSNGNYVVSSSSWAFNGTVANAGALTWGDGSTGLVAVVSPANSLVGTTANDQVGGGILALGNGNYVAFTSNWSNGPAGSVGAVTWADGRKGLAGTISAANSLIGTTGGDQVGFDGEVIGNSNYLVWSPYWSTGTLVGLGAVSQGRGNGGLIGTINATNSLIGAAEGGGQFLRIVYDATRDTVIVGQPSSNMVSLFKIDALFADGFE